MNKNDSIEEREKKNIALTSLFAAIFLTAFKLIVGLATNSLGIISEAAHSGLDLVAAAMTFFAIRVSSRPADEEHHYGHGKIENISALFETILLLVTCVWIIYEVIERLTDKPTEVIVSFWSFAVIIVSIIVDISRSRALNKVAKKYNSQALEADALHFSSDIWSSTVVLIGLLCVYFNIYIADSIAALIVAILVIIVSLRLGKRAIDVLIDKAPMGMKEKVRNIISEISEVTFVHNIRVRNMGPDTEIDVNIHLDPNITLEKAHDISTKLEDHVKNKIPRCEVHVHIEPENQHN
jgi:cation diffusion facilitator family transporter